MSKKRTPEEYKNNALKMLDFIELERAGKVFFFNKGSKISPENMPKFIESTRRHINNLNVDTQAFRLNYLRVYELYNFIKKQK